MFRTKAAPAALAISAFLLLAGCAHRHCHAAPLWDFNNRATVQVADRGCDARPSRPRHDRDRDRRDDHDDDDEASCPIVLRSQIELGGKDVNVEVTIWRDDCQVHTRVRLTPACSKSKLPDIDTISISLRAGGSNWRPSLCEVRSCDREIIFEAHDGPNWRKGRSLSVDLRVATDCDRDRVRWIGETLN